MADIRVRSKAAVPKKTIPGTPSSIKKEKSSKKKLLIAAGTLVVVGLFGLLLWQYMQTKSELKKYNDPNYAIKEESQDLVKQIQQSAVLPSNETPVPFEIKDVGKFQNNPVFAQAQNGDKGLIYQEAGWIIIYRPSTKQIIAASPVTLNEGETVQ